MNQKKLITLLPLLFIILITTAIGTAYMWDKYRESNCTGDRYFTDEGMSINFAFPCKWEVVTNIRISNTFVFNEEERLSRPMILQYEIALEKDDAKIELSKVLLATEGIIRVLDPEIYEYEVLDERVVRYRIIDAETYFYADYVKCEEVPTVKLSATGDFDDCAYTHIQGIGSQFATTITAKPGEMSISKVDDVVLNIF